ncbi:GYF domain-containing protein [Bdellovibrio sp. HCB2-146]|uniref:GYF domain-containing protein n=1 Tax=Bdellovibrio sp. HCB2-146 TaxID=3394362 RepID=UPI0039BC6739
MSKQYYLSNSGTHIGPFTLETVLKKVESNEHQWTDYVYDESIGKWLMLMEHPEFSVSFGQMGQIMGDKKSQFAEAQRLHEKEWFILRDGNNLGPFCRLEVITMLQEKTLFEYDFIWKNKMQTWKPVAEVPEFSPEKMRELCDSQEVSVKEVFFRRRHPRAAYGASIIVHNSKMVFKGHAFEISAGGAGIMIENKELQPGQSLFLHFQPGDGVPPFNAVCQIVSKQHVSGVSREEAPVKYGVKFTNLSQSVRETIKNFTSKTS